MNFWSPTYCSQNDLNSKQIKSRLGKSFIESVHNFVTNHIEPHESHFCFYLKLNLRHFEEYANSIHEGTNKGFKHNSTLVGPSANIEKHSPSYVIILKELEKSKVVSIDFR